MSKKNSRNQCGENWRVMNRTTLAGSHTSLGSSRMLKNAYTIKISKLHDKNFGLFKGKCLWNYEEDWEYSGPWHLVAGVQFPMFWWTVIPPSSGSNTSWTSLLFHCLVLTMKPLWSFKTFQFITAITWKHIPWDFIFRNLKCFLEIMLQNCLYNSHIWFTASEDL